MNPPPPSSPSSIRLGRCSPGVVMESTDYFPTNPPKPRPFWARIQCVPLLPAPSHQTTPPPPRLPPPPRGGGAPPPVACPSPPLLRLLAFPPPAAYLLKAFVKGVRGYFSYYLRRFSLCFCLNNAFQPVLRSQTATMVKKHFDFIICFALLNHKNSIRFVFSPNGYLGWVVYCSQYLSYDIPP